MIKVGIIFAMEEELIELLKFLKLENKYKIFDLEFYEGKLYNIHCVLVKSGIGKVNAARTTQVLIDNKKVDYIFNIGVAGGIDNNLKIEDIIIGKNLIQHDFDITAFNHKKGYIPEIGIYINTNKYLYETANHVLKNDDSFNVTSGTIASGDIFCTDKLMAKKINQEFNALCIEMEGAAIAQVCYLCNIPFLILRSISDTPNNNNNTLTYEEFLISSSKKIAYAMNKILKKIGEDNI